MGKKRDRLEIIYDILNIIRDNNSSIKPTPLLRFSNLSSQRFNEYYRELIEKEFIQEEFDKNKRKLIKLTGKGADFIRKYSQMIGIIEEFEL